MAHQIIQAIATEVAGHLSGYAWAALALQVVLMVGAAAVAALFGAYLKERGKHLAAKDDFAELQRQLEANTKLVETVRSEVAQRDWADREWATLRRLKIETLLEKMNECRAYLRRYQTAAGQGKALEERDPIKELEAIVDLYLPELGAQTKAFSEMHKEQIHEGLKLRAKLANAETEKKSSELKFDYGWQVAKTERSKEAAAF